MSRLLHNLEKMIAIPTAFPDGDEEQMAKILGGKLESFAPDELHLATAPREEGPDAAWVFARWGEPRILLNVHLDTVPAGPGWHSDPLQMVRDGERVYGLGVADVKGSIAAILEALERQRPQNLAILFSGDEERGNVAMRHFLSSPQSRGIGTALVCEPTQNKVGSRHRGILSLLVSQEGPGGHSSRADFTPSPVADLAQVAVDLQRWGQGKVREEGGNPEFPGMCLNLGRFEGGIAFNVIPASAELEISARPAPGNVVEQVRDELVSRIRALAPEARIRSPLSNPPFQSQNPEEFVSWLGKVAEEPIPLGFWTEAALLSEAGINAVVFGPGNIAQAHAANEWIEVAQLEEAVELFEGVIAKAAGRAWADLRLRRGASAQVEARVGESESCDELESRPESHLSSKDSQTFSRNSPSADLLERPGDVPELRESGSPVHPSVPSRAQATEGELPETGGGNGGS